LTATFEYNNPESLERIFAENPNQVAAVILEPVGVVEPQKDFLKEVAAMARRYGALLIFDEIVTGFRWALGGAQEYFGVTPDLACFGKALGNGFPISAVAGRREVMQIFDQIFFSFTFGGEAISLAAAVATIRRIRENPVIQHLWDQGQRLKDGYNVMASEFGLSGQTECVGYPCRTVISFRERDGRESLVLKSLFQQEVLKRGILSAGYHNVSFAHQPAQIDSTLRVYRTALEILAEAVESGEPARWLEGAPVEPVFRRM
jgi:glutamate-1-semialdehyde 2,1-aminomutase/spore coat polysaccharide biosynthesis protein SpsF